jgi:translation initiation factor IF-3
MRTLACTFLINGINTKVALRKRGREKRFQIVVRGQVLEYTYTNECDIQQVDGPELTETALLPHIEWMIRHYFTDAKKVQ